MVNRDVSPQVKVVEVKKIEKAKKIFDVCHVCKLDVKVEDVAIKQEQVGQKPIVICKKCDEEGHQIVSGH